MPNTDPSPMKPVTLKMVAKAARVSESAVCHILKGRARSLGISVACEKRVQAAAQRLGYLGNWHARALAMRSSHSIGVTITNGSNPFLDNAYWGTLAAGIELECRLQKWDLHMIGGHLGEEDIVVEAFNQLQAQRINGLIIFTFLYPQLPEILTKPGLPIVFMEGRNIPKVSSVSLDPNPGIDAAMEHLHELGHRHVIYLGQEGEADKLYLERILRMREQAQRLGLLLEERYLSLLQPRPYVTTRNDSLRAQATNFSSQIQSLGGGTALLCANDEMAMIIMKILSDRGIKVPEEVSIIGFDDIWAGQHLPGITTISHSLLEMGRQAVALLIEILAGKHQKKSVVLRVPAKLIIRETTAAARS